MELIKLVGYKVNATLGKFDKMGLESAVLRYIGLGSSFVIFGFKMQVF
jgi:hypothetical protein